MEQPEYLIDTNAVIDYLGNKLTPGGSSFMDTVIDKIPRVSVITRIEVLGFNAAEEHYQLLTFFMNDAHVFELSEAIVEESIYIRKRGRTRLPDAIIAATALVNNLILITRNVSDFKNIPRLEIVNLYDKY